jgi:hypothetical protein
VPFERAGEVNEVETVARNARRHSLLGKSVREWWFSLGCPDQS